MIINKFTNINEDIISSKTNDNGTTSVKYTARRINILFFLSLIVGASVVYGFYPEKDSLLLCQESYIKATNEIVRYNENNPNYPISLPEYNCNKLINLISSSGGYMNIWASSPPPKRQIELDKINKLICKKQINSPLCKDKELLGRLYDITEERLPMKQFFPILIGMTNAESSLGLDFAKDKVGWTCTWRNNWGWAKYQILDDNSRVYARNTNWFDYKYPRDQYDCNLFPFESIEEYWISKVNGIRYWYKGCIDSARPIECISYAYVGSNLVAERSWINNVSYFLQ